MKPRSQVFRLGQFHLGRLLTLAGLAALVVPGGCVSRVDDGGAAGGSGGSGGAGGSGGYSPYGCLSAGTRITTPQGTRRIEDLAVGDLVLSLDHETGELRENRVTATRRLHRPIGEVRIPGGRIFATEEHPFFDARTGRYVLGADIDVDTALVTLPYAEAPAHLRADAALDSFLAAPYQPSVGEADVYDLTVERDHNYFAEGVLVHNKSGGGSPGGGGGSGGVPEGVCTRPLTETTPVVCSGPAEVGLSPNQGSPAWFTWDLPVQGGLGGEPGLGGASSGDDTIVVAFQVCRLDGLYHGSGAAFFPFVAPNHVVLAGASETGPCTDPPMHPIDSGASGQVGTYVGWVHVAVPLDEFECLYLATEADPDLCAVTAAD